MGVIKKPSVERGPKATTAARHPQIKITAGVRQDDFISGAVPTDIVFSGSAATKSQSGEHTGSIYRPKAKLGDAFDRSRAYLRHFQGWRSARRNAI
jgi:hypothetical protein